MKNEVECCAYGINQNIQCQVSTDGLVWAIPDTDFDKEGTVDYAKSSVSGNGTVKPGTQGKYVPITIYPNYKSEKNAECPGDYLYENAVIYGIRADGKVVFLDNVVNCTTYPRSIQCLAMENITSSKMKKR